MKTILALVLAAGTLGTSATTLRPASRSASTSRACTAASTSATCRVLRSITRSRSSSRRRPSSSSAGRSICTFRRRISRTGAATAASTSACGQPVYFVRDEWVRERYEHEHPGWNNGRHRGWDKHDGHGDHDDHGQRPTARRTSTELRSRAPGHPPGGFSRSLSCFWNTSPACSRSAWKRDLRPVALDRAQLAARTRRSTVGRVDGVVGDAVLRCRR